ncbi:MAG: hypothetical protein WA919_24065 [Coleofasciculaceae cyanobacterium]
MIHRFFMTSGLVLTSTLAFSPKALAQSVDVPFEANIGPECSFAAPVAGRLVYRGDSTVAGPNSITSDAPGGVSGQVDVSCNTPASIQITDARFVSFTPTNPDPGGSLLPPGGFPNTLEARATVPGAETLYIGPAEGGAPPSPSMPLFPSPQPPLRQTVKVDLSVENAPVAGIYQYAVTLTIAP